MVDHVFLFTAFTDLNTLASFDEIKDTLVGYIHLFSSRLLGRKTQKCNIYQTLKQLTLDQKALTVIRVYRAD